MYIPNLCKIFQKIALHRLPFPPGTKQPLHKATTWFSEGQIYCNCTYSNYGKHHNQPIRRKLACFWPSSRHLITILITVNSSRILTLCVWKGWKPAVPKLPYWLDNNVWNIAFWEQYYMQCTIWKGQRQSRKSCATGIKLSTRPTKWLLLIHNVWIQNSHYASKRIKRNAF